MPLQVQNQWRTELTTLLESCSAISNHLIDLTDRLAACTEKHNEIARDIQARRLRKEGCLECLGLRIFCKSLALCARKTHRSPSCLLSLLSIEKRRRRTRRKRQHINPYWCLPCCASYASPACGDVPIHETKPRWRLKCERRASRLPLSSCSAAQKHHVRAFGTLYIVI